MKSVKLGSKIIGTKDRPRISVSKSNKYIYAQIIDDENQKTLVSGNDKAIKINKSDKSEEKISTKVKRANILGMEIAKKAKTKKIVRVVFDRGKYRYHGRVKALADGLREGGLKF